MDKLGRRDRVVRESGQRERQVVARIISGSPTHSATRPSTRTSSSCRFSRGAIKSEFEKAVAARSDVDRRAPRADPVLLAGARRDGRQHGQGEGTGARDREAQRDARPLSRWRQLLERDKDVAGAEKEYAAADRRRTGQPRGLSTTSAQFYRRQKRYDDAVADYERLLKDNVPMPSTLDLNIAYTLVSVRTRASIAREREIKQWLAEPPKDARRRSTSATAHYLLGNSRTSSQAKKDVAQAQSIRRRSTINPKNEDAKKALDALK